MSDFSLSAALFARLRAHRRLQRISAQSLADRMTAQGFRIARSVIAAGEIGRVRSMSVDYASHAARALGLTLTQLISEPAACPACKGEPPTGFTCNACGTAGGAA